MMSHLVPRFVYLHAARYLRAARKVPIIQTAARAEIIFHIAVLRASGRLCRMMSHHMPRRVQHFFLLIPAHAALLVTVSRLCATGFFVRYPLSVSVQPRGAHYQFFESAFIFILRLFRGKIKPAAAALPILRHASVHTGGRHGVMMFQIMPRGRQFLSLLRLSAHVAAARLHPSVSAVDIGHFPLSPIVLAGGFEHRLRAGDLRSGGGVGKIFAANGAMPVSDVAVCCAGGRLCRRGGKRVPGGGEHFFLYFSAHQTGAVTAAVLRAGGVAAVAPAAPVVIVRGGEHGLLLRYLSGGGLIGKQLAAPRALPILNAAARRAGRRDGGVMFECVGMLFRTGGKHAARERKRQNGAQNKDKGFSS